MRQWIRSHLTYANVMVTILAFIVLGGGTAVAAFVVSSNSQIGPNTIYGHKAPAGANKNIVAGSVNGQDVADDSLGGADIIEETLTGRTRKLIYNATPSSSAPITTIAALDPYTIKGQCRDFPTPSSMHAALFVNGPAGTADWMATETFDDAASSAETGSRRVPIPASTDTHIFNTFSAYGHFSRIAGTVMLRSGANLIQVDVNAVADGRSPRHCYLYGTATKALG